MFASANRRQRSRRSIRVVDRRTARQLAPVKRACNAERAKKNWGSVSGNATHPGLKEPGIGWHLSETTADEFQEYSRAALRRLDFCFAGGQCLCARQN